MTSRHTYYERALCSWFWNRYNYLNCYFFSSYYYFYVILQHSPKNYAFGYAVKDDYTGDDYSHKESRDGYTTSGEYRVCL